mmetsp:Transcript_18211/g.23480  ORF Transcript_18211/g.23480 Transcript_18211/m.23480 type:complete len:494 (+) Transcript_18211:196-1677(+)
MPVSIGKFVSKTWSNTLPFKIRIIQGKPRFFLGGTLQVCCLAVFLALLLLELQNKTTSHYISLFKEEKTTSTADISCFEIPLTTSDVLEVDELGYWSSSSKFDSKQALKQVAFTDFSGDTTLYDEDIKTINSCIDEMNTVFEENSLLDNLLFLDAHSCSTNQSKVTFPITWPYVFDASYADVWVEDMDGYWISEISAEVSVASGELYNLEFSCSNAASNLSDTSVCSGGEDYSITLNVDSITRCLHVNHGYIDASYIEDLQILYKWYDATYAVYTGTDSPNQMVLYNDTCYIYYDSRDYSVYLEPRIEYWDEDCRRNCSDPEREYCSNDFDINLRLKHLGSVTSDIVINTYGGLGYVNDNYFLMNLTESSCNPLLNTLEYSSEQQPFTLIESFYNCTQISSTSPLVALSSAYANTGLAAEFLLIIAVIVGLKFCNKESVLASYDDDELTIANYELAIARIEEKRALNLACDKVIVSSAGKLQEEGGEGDKSRK